MAKNSCFLAIFFCGGIGGGNPPLNGKSLCPKTLNGKGGYPPPLTGKIRYNVFDRFPKTKKGWGGCTFWFAYVLSYVWVHLPIIFLNCRLHLAYSEPGSPVPGRQVLKLFFSLRSSPILCICRSAQLSGANISCQPFLLMEYFQKLLAPQVL